MSTYQVIADNYSASPYIKVRRLSVESVHHKTELARIERWAREYWGDKAGAIRHADGNFTVVWMALTAPSFPGLSESYGSIRLTVEL